MDSERFRRVQEVFHAALDAPARDRERFVFEACREDWSLYREVLSLLDHHATDDWTPGDDPATAGRPSQRAREPDSARALTNGNERYELVDILGEGGMGIVYLAEQTHPIRRRVALKVIKLGVDSRRATARFESERQALALMDHPNIARVFEAGATEDGRLYFAMEYVPGRPISEFCDQAKLSVDERVRLFTTVCDAVQHAHQKGIIHRDLKPSNILVATQGASPEPKIIDFGVARAMNQRLTEHTMFTQLGVVVGSFRYMSPEQADCRLLEIDTRTDIYALGAVLYELLTGDTPIDAPTIEQTGYAEVQRRIREEEPAKMSERAQRLAGEDAATVATQRGTDLASLSRRLKGDLDWIVLKALDKERTRRYATAAEFSDDLRRHLANEPVLAGPPTRAYRLRKFVRRNRVPVVAGTAVALAVVLGLVASTTLFLENRASRRVAEAQRDQILRLSDANVLAQLESTVDDLRPPHPERVPAMEEWLADADVLASRLPAHRATLAALRAHALHADAPAPPSFASQEDQFHFDHLSTLVADLERFVDPDPHVGSIARVRERHAFATSVMEESIHSKRREWNDAIRSIASIDESPRYGGLVIAPQVGLVPLGRDRASGLWEFVHIRTGKAPVRGRDGRWVMAEETGIVLVLLPGACYWMGMSKERLPDPAMPSGNPLARFDEVPVHRVCLDPFFISKYEVTQAQYQRMTGANPSRVRPGIDYGMYVTSLRHPVENLDWAMADAFSRDVGLELPTEAQWEYAGRAGSTARFPCGWDPACLARTENILDASARVPARPGGWSYASWHDGFVDSSPVGFFAPNAFGLHDVMGNVTEWTRDWYGSYQLPVAPGDGERLGGAQAERVVRGGGFYFWPDRVNLALRLNLQPHINDRIGVRPARAVDPADRVAGASARPSR
ncbi:MAG TPA: bifunctional serine/threonine-protein kinase/formylglycine-generating enzyme family protein [Candidatus Krumholzibacteria bacterium]|nr:bifunctional serine/threonine-protein kinase/formylglycine-generating enzyme family protein [Candidatus Krumholzibacteria bacterium]